DAHRGRRGVLSDHITAGRSGTSVRAQVSPRPDGVDPPSAGADACAIGLLGAVGELLDRVPAAARVLVVEPLAARRDDAAARHAGRDPGEWDLRRAGRRRCDVYGRIAWRGGRDVDLERDADGRPRIGDRWIVMED